MLINITRYLINHVHKAVTTQHIHGFLLGCYNDTCLPIICLTSNVRRYFGRYCIIRSTHYQKLMLKMSSILKSLSDNEKKKKNPFVGYYRISPEKGRNRAEYRSPLENSSSSRNRWPRFATARETRRGGRVKKKNKHKKVQKKKIKKSALPCAPVPAAKWTMTVLNGTKIIFASWPKLLKINAKLAYAITPRWCTYSGRRRRHGGRVYGRLYRDDENVCSGRL